ncbi:hypothetical protein FRX31_019990 [Thalictrum thalictroides]|uniref:Uncharacterized protein n=1 Tax=Thalictrum thalictroides TaxID=46969 RepID=A0A7J6W0F9_THATH|nr:hypothetical protein FRX31_019990 [Thalictrum thalictroides]
MNDASSVSSSLFSSFPLFCYCEKEEELTTTTRRLHSLSQLDLSLYLIELLEQTSGSLPKFQISQRFAD